MNKQLEKAYEDYIKLLGEELSEVVGIATVRGWKSTRIQDGERLRMIIYNLKNPNWQKEHIKQNKNRIKIMKEFNEYNEFVKSMKVYPEKHAIVYPALGLAGEAGEISEKVKKWLRGDKELDKVEVLKEAGDCLWYLASIADDLGYTLQDMVEANVEKLSSRKERGVLKGDGDNR
jgi:NTP pyrophosphatase (non-canonical NTP hydrolase)